MTQQFRRWVEGTAVTRRYESRTLGDRIDSSIITFDSGEEKEKLISFVVVLLGRLARKRIYLGAFLCFSSIGGLKMKSNVRSGSGLQWGETFRSCVGIRRRKSTGK